MRKRCERVQERAESGRCKGHEHRIGGRQETVGAGGDGGLCPCRTRTTSEGSIEAGICCEYRRALVEVHALRRRCERSPAIRTRCCADVRDERPTDTALLEAPQERCSGRVGLQLRRIDRRLDDVPRDNVMRGRRRRKGRR